ncbi:MAG: PolC-type DNA polymerase III [Clostridiales bacterium]|nr:PolC-type DNA polymerase III [Clostridiales bacterium]
MINLIEGIINWSKLGSHPRECYKFSLGRAQMSQESATLSIDIGLNFVMPFEDTEKIRAVVINQIKGLKDVKLNFQYQDMIQTPEEIITFSIEHMIDEVNGEYASSTKTIFPEETVVEDSTVTVYALGAVVVKELNEKVSPLFKRILKRDFGFEVQVVFENHRDEYQKLADQKRTLEKLEEKQILEEQKRAAHLAASRPAAPSSANNSGGVSGEYGGNGGNNGNKWNKRRKEEPVVGNRILGEPINTMPVKLSSVSQDSGQVTIEGILFRKDNRTIKNEKKLVTLLITDKSTSLCIKAFTSENKWNEIDEHLKSGDFVKIRGAAEWDTYENIVVVMARDIEKGEIKKRKDTCERKRVELHAHSKMSAMDGLNEIKDMVRTHEEWGHPAMALTDHGVVQGFPEASHSLSKGSQMKIIYGMEGYVFDDRDCINPDGTIEYKKKPTNHIIILARTQEGLKNLYKLVSISHLQYFYKRPRIPKSVLTAHREGLIIGAACEAGEVFRAVLQKQSEEEIEYLVNYYDYLEIQPIVNNQFLIEKGAVKDKEGLRDLNRQIVALGQKYNKPVVATTDSHYPEPEASLYRNILMAGQGYKELGGQGLYLRTTQEMLEEFEYLGKDMAEKVVIDNTNLIADMIDVIRPVPKEKYPPKIPNAEETLKTKCYERAWSIYGKPLPPEIQERLDAELVPIIREGYAVMYIAAEMLVQKSLSDGYLVGSRGSVGSSFAATMAGITEVNPLPPHYICPECKYLEWGDNKEYDCGVDMEDKDCPKCGTPLKKDGFSIPFQTFLGFEADKEPDIDLNFAGEYQPIAHKYVDEIFGAKNVFKAGTIGTVATKTAYGFVMKYFEERQIPVNKYEVERLAECCTGVRRTTGQHPGGIIIVPDDHEIYEFCPIQHPANDVNSDFITTHFDYHSIDQNLLKLDILGHDVPSMIRHLQDMTGLDPLTQVPLSDPKVNSIFNGIEGLDIKEPDYRFVHGSYGIPEFGTKFTRQMLDDTHPTRFADYVRISGFSHGTDVWINNAQEWIRSGQTTIKDAISTRDDIMNYLILKGLPKKSAFTIMEKVRKGKGVNDEDVALMQEHDVPEWYIESCRRIKYMFPRAHAVAYVMMSYRIAYFKVYYPVEFYATYFTTKVSEFDADTILKGAAAVLEKMDGILAKGKNATKKEEDEVIVLEVAYEMYARGYEFMQAQLGVSHATKFYAKDGKVLLPFVALGGVGENAAKAIVDEYEIRPFETIDEIRERAKANKTAIEALREHGVLKGLPESDQLCLF